MAEKETKETTIEESFQALDEIITKMESSDVTLDESFALYKSGMEELQKSDPLLKIETLAYQGREYAGDVDLTSPAVSPVYGDLKGLPPISVFSGTHDILSADAAKLETIAENEDLDINVYLFINSERKTIKSSSHC
jgi:exodeoxyribonuclease VII small subunit